MTTKQPTNEPRDIAGRLNAAWYYVRRGGVDVCTGSSVVALSTKQLRAMLADIRRSFPKRKSR